MAFKIHCIQYLLQKILRSGPSEVEYEGDLSSFSQQFNGYNTF